MADVLTPYQEIVKSKMIALANVTGSAQNEINGDLLSMAATEMINSINLARYQDHVAEVRSLSPEEFELFDSKDFDVLSDAERRLRMLIYAESYYALYFLALALKKLVKGAVNVTRDSAGSATVYAAPFDDIIDSAERYFDLANQCIAAAFADDDDISELFVDGTFAVFVV